MPLKKAESKKITYNKGPTKPKKPDRRQKIKTIQSLRL